MKSNNRLILMILILLFFRVQANSCTYRSEPIDKTNAQTELTIDTFLEFPPEIGGCSCYFSNDATELKSRKYIYVADFENTAFLKINGLMTRFTKTAFDNSNREHIIAKYKSDKYEITIEIFHGVQNGDETWLKTGTIKLTDQIGNIITKKFIGECGC